MIIGDSEKSVLGYLKNAEVVDCPTIVIDFFSVHK